MLQVDGKYNNAKIYTNTVDQESISQIIQLCNQPFTAGSRIRMMPEEMNLHITEQFTTIHKICVYSFFADLSGKN